MERLMQAEEGGLVVRLRGQIAFQFERLFWECGRAGRGLGRRYGLAGWVFFACIGSTLVSAGVWLAQTRTLRELQAQLVQQRAVQEIKPDSSPETGAVRVLDDRGRLQAFADHLLPQRDIPAVLEEMFGLAEKEGLTLQRAEYRPQLESLGRFVRYNIILPVSGKPGSIHKFIRAVLLAQPAMALESIQFKRERVESGEIEARIVWVLFVRQPGGAGSAALIPVQAPEVEAKP